MVTGESIDMLKMVVVTFRATDACVNVGKNLLVLRSIVGDT